MKILITGRDGFIGGSLIGYFADLYEAHAPARSEVDLLDSAAIDEYLHKSKFDVVIHAAHRSVKPWETPQEEYKREASLLNLRMFFNLARNWKHYGKMIYFGSGAEMPRDMWTLGMREEEFGIVPPYDYYGLSKFIMNQHARQSHNIYNVRLFGVYGPGEDYRYRLISSLICQALYRPEHPVTLKNNHVYDWLYIDDLAEIVNFIAGNVTDHHDYNAATDMLDMDFSDILSLVFAYTGRDRRDNKTMEIVPRIRYGGDGSRFRRESRVNMKTLERGIVDMVAYYREHAQDVNKEDIDKCLSL